MDNTPAHNEITLARVVKVMVLFAILNMVVSLPVGMAVTKYFPDAHPAVMLWMPVIAPLVVAAAAPVIYGVVILVRWLSK
jgi:hypothetical protein